MKSLDLNELEEDMLVKVLKRCLADLEHEIAHTHHAEFKQMLRQRRSILDGIVRKLHTHVAQSA